MAVFSALTATLVAAGMSAFWAGVTVAALQIAAGIAISMIAKALAGEPEGSRFGVQVRLQGGDDIPRSVLFGYNCTAGSLVYGNTWGTVNNLPNAYLTQVIALADYPIQQLVGVEVNGSPVTLLTPAHPQYGNPVQEFRLNGVDHLWVKFYDGTQTTADSFLTGTVSSTERPYLNTRVGYGIPYVVATSLAHEKKDEEEPLFSGGYPKFKFVTNGAKLYDISKDTSAGGSGTQRWDTPSTWGGDGDFLPAVQIYNLLRGIRFNGSWLYGLQNLPVARLPNANWVSVINKCRVQIQGPSGLEPTYRTGGEIQVNEQIKFALETILTGCQGRLTETGGVYKLDVGQAGAAVMSFTDGDIISTEEQSFTPFLALEDTINGIQAKYPNPEEGWNVKTAPPLIRTDLEALDAGRRLMADVSLDMVPYSGQVQRLMKSALLEAQRARRHTLVLGPEYWLLEAGDIISWTSVRNGYSNKLFRVDGIADRANLDVMVDITEVDPSDYSWNQATDYKVVVPAPNTIVTSPPVATTGWQVYATTVFDQNGLARRPAIEIWYATGVKGVSGIKYQVRASGSTNIFISGDAPYGTPWRTVIQGNFPPNSTYQVRGIFVRSDRGKAVWSDWLSVTTPNTLLDGGLELLPGSVISSIIADNAITVAKMVDGAITNVKLAENAVAALNIQDGIIDAIKLANNAVTTSKLADSAITEAKLSSNAVTLGKIASGAVNTAALLDNAVSSIKIVDGAVSTAKLVDGAITTSKFATGIRPVEVVSVLPTTGNTEGRIVFLTTDDKLYRYNGTAFVATVASTDIAGTLADTQISAIAASKITGQLTDTQIEAVGAAKLTGTISTGQIADAALTVAKFASGVRPIEILATLPATGNFEGRMVFLTTDDKLYRYNGTAYVASVPSADITGTLSSSQIADSAITAAKLGPLAVGAAALAANAVTETKIADNAITTGKLTANAVIADKIAANAITTDKMVLTGSNLIANGDFATGSFTNWRLWSNPVSMTVLARDAVGVPANAPSRFVMKLTGAGDNVQVGAFAAAKAYSDAGADQDGFIVRPGDRYHVAIDVSKGSSGDSFTNAQVLAYFFKTDGTWQTSVIAISINSLTLTTSWQTITGEFTAPADALRCWMFIRTAGSTATPNSVLYVTNLVARQKASAELIVDGAITAGKLSVLADNLVNPVSLTKHLGGWGGVAENGTGTLPTGLTYDATENAMALTTASDMVVRSRTFSVRPDQIIKITARLKKSASVGTTYFGVAAHTVAQEGYVNSGNGQGTGLLTPYSATRVAATPLTNAYFGLQTAGSPHPTASYQDHVFYLIGSNRSIDDVPNYVSSFVTSLTPYLKMPADTPFAAVRVLNYANGGTPTTLWIKDIAVTDIDSGQIVANNITSSAITADKIATNAITADKINANAVTAGKIAAGAVTATEIAANAITASKLFLMDVTNVLPSFEDTAAFSYSAGSFQTSGAGFTALGSRVFTPSQTPASQWATFQSPSVPFESGAKVRISFDYYVPAGFNSRMYMQTIRKNADGTFTYATLDTLTEYNTTPNPTSFTAKYDKILTLPVSSTAVSIVYQLNIDHSAGWATKTYGPQPSWNNWRIQRAASAELIVDGAITAIKIAANTITANEIAAGAIAADEIAANAVTAVKINAGAVEAAKIAAGAIETDKLAALSVTAAKVAANAITADKIEANAITAGKIAAGAVSAAQITAGAITASKLLIGDTSNMVPDPDIVDIASWSFTGAGAAPLQLIPKASLTSSPMPGVNVVRSNVTSDAIGIWQSVMTSVEPGKSYYLSAHVGAATYTGSTADYSLQAYWYSAAGFLSSTVIQIAAGVTLNGDSRFSGIAVAPASAVGVRIAAYRTAETSARYLALGAPIIRKASSGELIVDGAITADKILTNAVTADKILAGSITTAKIAAQSITATKLYLGDTSNMIPDPEMVDLGSWAFSGATGPLSFISKNDYTTDPFPGTNLVRSVETTEGANIYNAQQMPVEPGRQYYLSAHVGGNNLAGSSTIYSMRAFWYNNLGGFISNQVVQSAPGSEINGTTRFTGIVTAPINAVALRLSIDRPAVAVANYLAFGAAVMRRAASAEMIVDGAVTADKLAANSVVAGKVAAGAIFTQNLSVVAAELINPVSLTHNDYGWGGLDENGGGSYNAAWVRYDATENAMRIGQSGVVLLNIGLQPDTFRVHPDKIYRLACKVRKEVANGIYYIGATISNVWRQGNASPSNTGGGVAEYWIPNRGLSTSGNNIYFASGVAADTAYREYVIYILGSNRSIDDAPAHYDPSGTLSYAYVRMPTTHDWYAPRFLNYGNTVANSMFVKDVSITEVGAGRIVTQNLEAGAVTADKIKAGGVFANSISAVALRMINPVSTVGHVGGWGSVLEDGSNEASIPNITYNATERALQFTSSLNDVLTSDSFRVDHNKIYRIGFRIKKSTTIGRFYVGSRTSPTFLPGIAPGAGSANLGSGATYNDLRALTSSVNTNHYYVFPATNACPTSYIDYVGYIIGANRDIADAPNHVSPGGTYTSTPYYKMAETDNFYALRVLNYNNTGVAHLYLKDISITEVGSGQIVTDNLVADAVTANKLAANSVVAANIVGGTITGAKIAGGTITAGLMAANSIQSSHITAGAVIAGKLAADSISTNTLFVDGVVITAAIAANNVTYGDAAINVNLNTYNVSDPPVNFPLEQIIATDVINPVGNRVLVRGSSVIYSSGGGVRHGQLRLYKGATLMQSLTLATDDYPRTQFFIDYVDNAPSNATWTLRIAPLAGASTAFIVSHRVIWWLNTKR